MQRSTRRHKSFLRVQADAPEAEAGWWEANSKLVSGWLRSNPLKLGISEDSVSLPADGRSRMIALRRRRGELLEHSERLEVSLWLEVSESDGVLSTAFGSGAAGGCSGDFLRIPRGLFGDLERGLRMESMAKSVAQGSHRRESSFAKEFPRAEGPPANHVLNVRYWKPI